MAKQKTELNVVQFITDDDGHKADNDFWHLVDPGNSQGNAALCTQEFFGPGESPLQYVARTGEVNCPECLKKLRLYKAAAQKAGV